MIGQCDYIDFENCSYIEFDLSSRALQGLES